MMNIPILPPTLRLCIVCAVIAGIGAAHGQTAWTASARVGNEAKFLLGSQILRYDLPTKSWLTPFALPQSGATAMAADAQGAVVAYGTAIRRYSETFTDESNLGSVSSSVLSLFLDGNLVIAIHSQGLYGRVTVFNRATGATLSSAETYVDSMHGTSHASGTNSLYGRSQGVSPSDIVTASYSDAGVVGKSVDSIYHGDYPSATQTWVFPDETRVVDSSGTVYTAPGLNYFGSMAGSVTDIAFNGDVPVVLRGGELIGYTRTLLETGRGAVGVSTGTKLFVTSSEAFVFSPATGNPSVNVVSLATIAPSQPGTLIDPRGLVYTQDDVFVDKDDTLLLFSKSQLSLFRWSSRERRYLPTLSLLGVPKYAAYSKQTQRAYFAYDTQWVRAMDPSASNPTEQPLCALPSVPKGLATAGEFIFGVGGTGTWSTHSLFNPTGTLTDSKGSNYFSRVWEWDPVQRRMYFFRDGITPNDLHYETIDAEGKITGKGETPYGGSFTVTPPIRVNPDGSQVVIGSGVVFETTGLTRLFTLPNTFTDALWRTGELLTIRASGSTQTQLQRWNSSTFAAGTSVPLFTGTPLRLMALNAERCLLITLDRGMPRFHLLNADLSVSYDYLPDAPRISGPPPQATEDMPFAWSPVVWKFPSAGSVTLSASVLPAWLTFSNGSLTGTPREADSGDQLNRSQNHRVVLRAVDSNGLSEEREFTVTSIWQNDAPTFKSQPAPISANDRADDSQLDLGVFLIDPDGNDTHLWEITSVTHPEIFSTITVNQDGLLQIAYAPYLSGTSMVTIQVTDASGASAQTTIQVVFPELPEPVVTSNPLIRLSRLTGLYEQTITVTNVAARAIAGFDLTISGLRVGAQLYNGTSTENGGGLVSHHQPVQAGQSVTLVLEYYASPRGEIPPPTFTTSLFIPVSSSRQAMAEVASFAINRVLKQADGSVVIEFNATPGSRYRIQYSEDASHWKSCPVSIKAGGTKVQWIDRGPPWTDASPASIPRRFYRVECLDP